MSLPPGREIVDYISILDCIGKYLQVIVLNCVGTQVQEIYSLGSSLTY